MIKLINVRKTTYLGRYKSPKYCKIFKFCITFFENLPLFLSRKIPTLGRKHCYESLVGSYKQIRTTLVMCKFAKNFNVAWNEFQFRRCLEFYGCILNSLAGLNYSNSKIEFSITCLFRLMHVQAILNLTISCRGKFLHVLIFPLIIYVFMATLLNSIINSSFLHLR